MMGQMNSFQTPLHCKTNSVVKIGLANGIAMVPNMRSSLAPSRRAASNNSSGNEAKKVRITMIWKAWAPAAIGSQMPQSVLLSLRSITMMKRVSKVRMPGIIIKPRIPKNSADLAGKS